MKNYLIISESYKKRNEEINKIINNSLNIIKYDLRINTLKEVINEASYFDFDNTPKYIIINASDLFKNASDEDTKLLENYFKNPNEIVSLIFTTDAVDKRKKVYKLFSDIITINTLNKKDLVYECINILKNNGYKADYETCNYIVENSYVNYDIMLSEIDKIKLILKKGSITINDIKDIISKSVNDNIFKYLNAVMEKNIKDANYYARDFERLKIDPFMVIILLYKEYNILYLYNKGIDLRKMFNKEDWQIKNYMRLSNLYDNKEIKKIIIKLHDYDYKLKSGKLDSKIAINLLTLDLCS